MTPFFTKFIRASVLTLASLTLFGCAAKFDYKDPVSNMPFVFVKGGTYLMGSNDRKDEQPTHEVSVPDLYVGIHEVTFDQFEQFCTLPKCEPPYDNGWGRGNRPVIHVTWHDANAYAAWLSEQTGLTYRLPSESEWEYFARAGTTTPYWSGDTLPRNVENCRNCNRKNQGRTTPVGSFKPNPWGLFDILGNAFEWVQDDYRDSYDNAPTNGKPAILPDAKKKSLRGGSWRANKTNSTVSAREFSSPRRSNNRTSFRLVLETGAKMPPPQPGAK